jgi:YARHG domain
MRHGAAFHDQETHQQFRHFTWYHPNSKLTFDDIDELMSEIEKQNVKVLAERRAKLSTPDISQRQVAQEPTPAPTSTPESVVRRAEPIRSEVP